MAYRRCLLTRGDLIGRRCHPSFCYVLHSDEGKREQPDEKSCSVGIGIGNFFIQRRSFGSSLNGSMGLFAPSQDRLLSPLAGYSFCRNMSTWNQGSDKIEIMTDVADVLNETTMEAVASQVPIVNEVAVAAADSFLPIKVLQYVIDAVHCYTGLNWWAAIALTTLLIRSATLPLSVNQLKNKYTIRLNKAHMEPRLEEILQQLDPKEIMTMDPEALAKVLEKIVKQTAKLFKEYGVNLYAPLVEGFVQGTIFISFFLAVTNMAEKMPSFKHGGAYWFVDLSTPDPLRIFPVLTALSCLVLVEFKYMQEEMKGNPLRGIERQVCRGLLVLTVPFTLGFAKGIFCFWITSNLFSLMRGIVLELPVVKKTLGILEIPATEPSRKNKK